MVARDIPFDFSQPAGQVIAIILFLIPGLSATWVIERLAGRTSISGTERLLRALALSVFIYLLASPWLLRIAHRAVARALWPWEPIMSAAVLVFIAPVALGVGWAWARGKGALLPVLDEYEPMGSTDGISFVTAKPCVATRRSHCHCSLTLRPATCA